MTNDERKCGNCDHWRRIINRIASQAGICYAPIPHCVPFEHRITRETESHAGINCMAWRGRVDVYDSQGNHMKFRIVE